MRTRVIWGAVWGVLQAASPLGFWWLPPATVYGLEIALIAAIYIGFGVSRSLHSEPAPRSPSLIADLPRCALR